MEPAALLCAHLHDAFVAPRGRDHPFAFVDEKGHGLLDVDVLAGGAGEDGHERVPMIGGGNNDRLQVLVLVHLAKVAIAFGLGAEFFKALFEARLMGVAHGSHVHVLLVLEVGDVLASDETKADEPHLYTVVSSQNSLVRGGGQCTQSTTACDGHGRDSIMKGRHVEPYF